ncbi:MAG: FAD-binding oxidoreductase [Gammaproteobacteria bacterium]|nr:FAD-binding oxidoreductase [Gammaproteobacteria bacterium]
MSHTDFDTFIIGQGLAGSALAWHLAAAGERVCVIDDGHRSSSSMVAAGLINPLAGMRFNRRPEMDDWLTAAERWYTDLAQQFGRRFHHPLPMLRLFRSPGQRPFYRRRIEDPASAGLAGAAFAANHCPEPIEAPFGGFVQQRTGYVDLPLLLGTLRDWLASSATLLQKAVEYGDIDCRPGQVRIDGSSARRIVFCDGARSRDNPWFGHLPWAPDKGEILNLVDDAWQPRHIINGAHWLVPLANGELRFGATHAHSAVDLNTTAEAREALLAGYQALRPGTTVAVAAHVAGIRPGTADRNPLLGRHADMASVWICNGFGARGALTIPWYAQRLAAHLIDAEPLPAEADIARL